ncbi:hypothetical protein ACC690_39800, partial [Rhizobium johnstonii]|uniref:hypothetical protein n=1 Tax=Rhizobium johnstonii TaxID=3019933 RepID=UPI003F9A1EEA
GIPVEHLVPYGHDKANVSAEFIAAQSGIPSFDPISKIGFLAAARAISISDLMVGMDVPPSAPPRERSRCFSLHRDS